MRPGRSLAVALTAAITLAGVSAALATRPTGAAAAEGQVTWAVHITLAPTWFEELRLKRP